VIPASKQKDIETLVAGAAKRLDPRTFDVLRKTRNRVIDILKNKQAFILNCPSLPIPPDAKAQIEPSYPQIVGMLDAYMAETLFDGKRLQKGDFRSLIDGYSKTVMERAEALAKTLPEDNPIRSQLLGFVDIEAKVETISKTEAEVKLTMPGPNGEPIENAMNLVLTEGRWLPKEMVRDWERVMAQANEQVKLINGDQIHGAVTGLLAFINAPLNNLKNAKTQEDFDKNIQEIMGIAQGMMMGGPGFGPPGGPIPPGAPIPPGGKFPPGGKVPPGGQVPPNDGGAGSTSSQAHIND
jgi:hypothetical protein